jgi:hypothetical protein
MIQLNQEFISNLYDQSRVIFTIRKSLSFEESILPRNEFDRLLLEAVDEGLCILGESSKQAIYFHLERNFGIKKDEIPSKLEAFSGALEQIFGFGANFIEISITRDSTKNSVMISGGISVATLRLLSM